MSVPVSELQSVAPSAIIELFELQLNTAIQGTNTLYRFHAGSNMNANGDIVWNGNAYLQFPIEATGFEYSGNGQLPRPKIKVSNILGTITAIILATPLEGAQVSRIRTMARYIDAVNFTGGTNPYGTPDPTAEFPREVYYIDRKSSETRDVVEFELCAAFDLQGVRAPKRQCISNICQWVYRSAECGYTEANYFDENDKSVSNPLLDICGKKLSSCQIRFSAIKKTSSTTLGSATLNVDTTSGLIVGLPVSGFGVPPGTTIASITNSTSLTMSSTATCSTVTTITGTLSASNTILTLSSAANLVAGQNVSGAYIPSGTTIQSVSGTTITLNQRPYIYQRNGYFEQIFFFNFFQFYKIDTTNLYPGMYVFGSMGISSTISAVDSANGQITIAQQLPIFDFIDSLPVALYFMPASPGSSSYTFTGSNQFIFRNKDAALPFGSFPGVGTYFT